MRRFRDIPIKQKLTVIIVITTTAALLLAGVGIVVSDSILFRRYLQRDLSALARIIADNSTAALSFEDPPAAREMLATLKARSHVVAACIYRPDHTVLAQYARPGAASGCPPADDRDEVRSTSRDLNVTSPVVLNGRRIGTLVLEYDLNEISERMKLYSSTVLGVLIAASLIALLLSSRLRAVIASPVSKLAETAQSISETKDYSIRAEKSSGDELGVLVDAFNGMLAGIESRDDGLRHALIAREEALRQAQNARDSLKTTLASIGDAVLSTDVSGCVVFANRVAQSLLKSGEVDITGKHLDSVFKIINEFSRASIESPVTKVMRDGTVVGMANGTMLIAGDGTETPIDHTAAPIRADNGSLHGTVLVFRDATSRRKADETSRLLASIVESSDDAIIGHDLNGSITSWNKGAERIFGYRASEMMGRPSSAIAVSDSVDEMPKVLERIGNGERVDQFHAVRRTSTGKLLDMSITVSPVHDALGRIVGASKIARDITEQVRAAERLAQLNADLQRSNENLARSNEDLERFAFVASHDLQEPLRMITVYAQLLVRKYAGETDDETRMFITNIVGGTTRMRDLLADLLAYTEIGARPEQPLHPVDLNAVMEKVVQNLKVAIQDTGANIKVGGLPTLKAYEGHFIPLFQNLVGNAIKYRGEKPPAIRVSVERNDGWLQFAVADNGIGIGAEYHQKIFGAFKRLHGNKIPGTGIGLAICQRIVERYGGRIWVESEVGQGATFFFTLPEALSVDLEGN